MKKNKLYFLLVLMALFVFSSCDEAAEDELNNVADNLQELVDEIDDNVGGDLQAEKEKFYSKDGKFKILFTDNPTLSKEIVPTVEGDFDMYMYIYEETSRAEMIAYIDYPPEIINALEVEQMLKDAKEGSVNSMGLVISEEKEFMFLDNKALQFRADNQELYVDYLLFLVGNRFFQVAIMTESKYPSKTEAENFYNSLELLHE